MTTEEPVTRVFAIGLGDIEELHIRRITLENVAEEMGVVLQISLIERQSKLSIQLLMRGEGMNHPAEWNEYLNNT